MSDLKTNECLFNYDQLILDMEDSTFEVVKEAIFSDLSFRYLTVEKVTKDALLEKLYTYEHEYFRNNALRRKVSKPVYFIEELESILLTIEWDEKSKEKQYYDHFLSLTQEVRHDINQEKIAMFEDIVRLFIALTQTSKEFNGTRKNKKFTTDLNIYDIDYVKRFFRKKVFIYEEEKRLVGIKKIQKREAGYAERQYLKINTLILLCRSLEYEGAFAEKEDSTE